MTTRRQVWGRAGATALLVGTIACSATPAFGATVLTRGGGPGFAGPGGYAAYGGSAAPDSHPASSAQSAGVVLIDTVLPYQNAQAAGTGMVLTADGQVLTNYHVVQGAGTITVTVATTGQSYQATVVGTDPTDDVALLQLTGASGLTTVKADDDVAKVGDAVTAVGNAGGTGSLTAAAGSISSLSASVTAASEGSASGSETLSSMLETSADVVAGDSGGPLFDAEGDVVGIDTAASTGAEIDGYAIPIQRALAIVAQIRSGAETSTVRIGPAAFLGVELNSGAGYGYGDGYARDAGYASGATVGGVVSGGAAATAGLQAGDVITGLNGRTVSSAADVSAALVGSNPGDQVSIAWTDQAGAAHTGTVTLGASPVA